ncbi:MAG: hypothetical protein ACR2J7_00970 [Luteimonas sp.]
MAETPGATALLRAIRDQRHETIQPQRERIALHERRATRIGRSDGRAEPIRARDDNGCPPAMRTTHPLPIPLLAPMRWRCLRSVRA